MLAPCHGTAITRIASSPDLVELAGVKKTHRGLVHRGGHPPTISRNLSDLVILFEVSWRRSLDDLQHLVA
jgi:hypothetical protein